MRVPFRLTATLAQPLRVRRSPERSPRVSATLALRTHWFEQTNVRTHYVQMRFRTPRCTLADRLVLMAMAVAHHQKASRRELKHTCKRTYVRRTSKMQASKLAVTVTRAVTSLSLGSLLVVVLGGPSLLHLLARWLPLRIRGDVAQPLERRALPPRCSCWRGHAAARAARGLRRP